MAYICYDKLSKKKQKELNLSKRGSWGNVSPVTKKIASAKVYNRKKTQRQQREMPPLGLMFQWQPFQYQAQDTKGSKMV